MRVQFVDMQFGIVLRVILRIFDDRFDFVVDVLEENDFDHHGGREVSAALTLNSSSVANLA